MRCQRPPLASGMAWVSVLRACITICMFGDGATRLGYFQKLAYQVWGGVFTGL
jgi:TPP-dependent pyruvate/acetoin dehydrogenase alpha subunit